MGALFAYSFPLLSLLWTMLIFAGIFLMIFFIVWCFIDNLRRHDHHGMAKARWAILILFLPILGAAFTSSPVPQRLTYLSQRTSTTLPVPQDDDHL